MAKLLIGDELYVSLSSAAFFEFEYESLILSHASRLFAEHVAVPFKRQVESETGRATADLALIERRYRKWWVVEVELSHHSLSRHVLPQVAILANAKYGRNIAEYLSSQSDALNPEVLDNMMRGSQPQVLVVVNRHVSGWVQPLAAYGALLAVVEVFRSDRNRHVFRLNGDYPAAPGDEVSSLRCDPLLPRLLIVESPGALESPPDKRLLIEFEGETTEWTKITTKDKVWLSPVRSNPLTPGEKYALVKGEDGGLKLKRAR
jgi:hypothetical protein